jgi:hypothetical protein
MFPTPKFWSFESVKDLPRTKDELFSGWKTEEGSAIKRILTSARKVQIRLYSSNTLETTAELVLIETA